MKKGTTVGRYGARYGTTVRKRVAEVEKLQRAKKTCPFCRRKAIRRVTAGVWRCKRCNKKFTGNAYTL